MQTTLYAYRWPCSRPIVTATTAMMARTGFLLRLAWPDGSIGLGEAVSWPQFGTPAAAFAAGEQELRGACSAHGGTIPSPASPEAGLLASDRAPPLRAANSTAAEVLTATLPKASRAAALAWVDSALGVLWPERAASLSLPYSPAVSPSSVLPTAGVIASSQEQTVAGEATPRAYAGPVRCHPSPLPSEWHHALETALLDAAARALGVPVAALLAAEPAMQAPVHVLVATACEAREAHAQGARAFKVKIGRRALSDELGHLAGIRTAIGAAAELRLDVNGSWSPAVARQAMFLLPMVSPAWLEQPLPAAMLEEACQLRAMNTLKLAADEGLNDEASVAAHLAAEAADVYVLKPVFVGGPRATLRAARQILQAGFDVQVTHAMESTVGTLAALHIAAAIEPLPAELKTRGRVRAHGLRPALALDPADAAFELRWTSHQAARTAPSSASPAASSLSMPPPPARGITLAIIGSLALPSPQSAVWPLPRAPGLGHGGEAFDG